MAKCKCIQINSSRSLVLIIIYIWTRTSSHWIWLVYGSIEWTLTMIEPPSIHFFESNEFTKSKRERERESDRSKEKTERNCLRIRVLHVCVGFKRETSISFCRSFWFLFLFKIHSTDHRRFRRNKSPTFTHLRLNQSTIFRGTYDWLRHEILYEISFHPRVKSNLSRLFLIQKYWLKFLLSKAQNWETFPPLPHNLCHTAANKCRVNDDGDHDRLQIILSVIFSQRDCKIIDIHFKWSEDELTSKKFSIQNSFKLCLISFSLSNCSSISLDEFLDHVEWQPNNWNRKQDVRLWFVAKDPCVTKRR